MIPADVVTHQVDFTPVEALARLKQAIEHHKMTVFAHIDHALGAQGAGLDLRPTDLVVFGAPRAGTLLMQQQQEMGLDLPLKILVYQDTQGRTMLAYHTPSWIAGLYDLAQVGVVPAMSAALEAVVAEVVGGSNDD